MKAWLNMWRNAFNFTGTVSQKEYWIAVIMNIPIMCIFTVPFALILSFFSISPVVASIFYIIAFNIPTIALYFRRANDANWRLATAFFMAVVTPILSGIIVGAFPSIPKGKIWPRFYSVCGKIFSLSFGLFFYGGVLGTIFFGDPTALSFLSIAGLLLGTINLIYIVVKML